MSVLTSQPELLHIPEKAFATQNVQYAVEQFLYFEAELLDDRRYSDWLLLCADDITYRMPLRRNRTYRERGLENSELGELSHFDDNKKSLGWRVAQILTGKHWAEEPASRTRHLVTNIRIEPTEKPDEYLVRSNFFCYRNRLEEQVDMWVGERHDVLRQLEPTAWQIASRRILLDQNVVLSSNLSTFL